MTGPRERLTPIQRLGEVSRQSDYGDRRMPDRFWNKVYPCPITGCWLWAAATSKNGYGSWWPGAGGPTKNAHRAAYLILIGDVADGLELDHLCRTRCCGNPEHLEPVTKSINALRGVAPWFLGSINRDKPVCMHGHRFTEENTYVTSSGTRQCRTCKVANTRRYRAMRAGRGVA